MLDKNVFVAVLKQARLEKTACAAINILGHTTMRAVTAAACRAGRNVIVQPSAATVKKYGVGEMLALVDSVRKNASVQVALHLDHCRDDALAIACIDAGWDAVMMDYSALPLQENIEKTRKIVDYAHRRNAAVEGEIGVICGVEDDVSAEVAKGATKEETLYFVEQTGVDAVAPALGTAHGVYKTAPCINYLLMEQLGIEKTPVVVHGGTGLSEETFQKLIGLGAAKINISTALKHSYLDGARALLADSKIAPLDFDFALMDRMSSAMEQYIRLFAMEPIYLEGQ